MKKKSIKYLPNKKKTKGLLIMYFRNTSSKRKDLKKK